MKKVITAIALLTGAITSHAQATNPNPFARPVPSPVAQPLPGGLGPNPDQPRPPGAAFPSQANVSPGNSYAHSQSQSPAVVEETEEIPAVRIGKVNGKDIYRGAETYLFQKQDKNTKVTRKPIKQMAGAPVATTDPNGNVQNRGNLPSMVGRPAPRN